MKSSKSKRIIGHSPAGNRRINADRPGAVGVVSPVGIIRRCVEPSDWPESDSPVDAPDRDQECAGCASLQAEVSALAVEVTTLLETHRQHQAMIADLNARLSAQEWEQVRDAQGSARRRRSRLGDAGVIATEERTQEALEMARAMLDPENQPPQWSKEEALRVIERAMET